MVWVSALVIVVCILTSLQTNTIAAELDRRTEI